MMMLELSAAALAAVMAGVITQTPTPEHPAYDISCIVGRPVYALHDGALTTTRSHTLGNVVRIQGSSQASLYAHLHDTSPQRYVRKGELIGTCGDTGAWSYGPHLHLEVTEY